MSPFPSTSTLPKMSSGLYSRYHRKSVAYVPSYGYNSPGDTSKVRRIPIVAQMNPASNTGAASAALSTRPSCPRLRLFPASLLRTGRIPGPEEGTTRRREDSSLCLKMFIILSVGREHLIENGEKTWVLLERPRIGRVGSSCANCEPRVRGSSIEIGQQMGVLYWSIRKEFLCPRVSLIPALWHRGRARLTICGFEASVDTARIAPRIRRTGRIGDMIMAKLNLQLRSVCLYRLIQRSQVGYSVPNLGLQHFYPLHALVIKLKLIRAPAAGSQTAIHAPVPYPIKFSSPLPHHAHIEDAK